MATASRNLRGQHGADVARALGWPAHRVGFIGALGGLLDPGASMARPRSLSWLIMRHQTEQAHEVEARLDARIRAIQQAQDSQSALRDGHDSIEHLRMINARMTSSLAALKRELFPRGVDELTPVERRVAELVDRGLAPDDIASALFISRSTALDHLRNAYRKLGVSSREEMRMALRSGDGAGTDTRAATPARPAQR